MQTRQRSTAEDVRKLPKEVKAEVDRMLADCSNTYMKISDWLIAQGYPISKSSIVGYYLEEKEKASKPAIQDKGTNGNIGVD